MATGPEHYQAGERLLTEADDWLNADAGWKGQLTAAERVERRNSDLDAAQAHFTAALAAATALSQYVPGTGFLAPDRTEWYSAASRGAQS